MGDGRTIALFVIILSIYGIYLHSQGKLTPVLGVIVQDNETNDKVLKIGTFVLALIVYIFVLSLLDYKTGFYLTLLIITGALVIDAKKNGENNIINTLLGKGTK